MINTTSKCLFLAILSMLASQAAVAEPQFAVSREGSEFLFDYIPDENSSITALGFRVDIGDLDPESIDLSNCTAGVKPPLMGFCKANPAFGKVLVYSNSGDVLPTTHIGSIKVPARAVQDAGGPRQLSGEGKNTLRRGTRSAATDSLGAVKVADLSYSDVDGDDVDGSVIQ